MCRTDTYLEIRGMRPHSSLLIDTRMAASSDIGPAVGHPVVSDKAEAEQNEYLAYFSYSIRAKRKETKQASKRACRAALAARALASATRVSQGHNSLGLKFCFLKSILIVQGAKGRQRLYEVAPVPPFSLRTLAREREGVDDEKESRSGGGGGESRV